MSHFNKVSIARAVLDVVNYSEGLTGGVLSRAPGDGAAMLCGDVAAALGMAVLHIRTPSIEYHTGAMSVGVGVPFEEAVATGNPVLVILDEAQSAETGMLEAILDIMSRRVEAQPCAVLAITTSAGERSVAERMAKGLDVSPEYIRMHRTGVENARLVERVLAAHD